jgi:hypothetical protein
MRHRALFVVLLCGCGEAMDPDAGMSGDDAGMLDAGREADGGSMPDAGMSDGGREDDGGRSDAGMSDGGGMNLDGGRDAGMDAGMDGGMDAAACSTGQSQPCYGGPEGTEGVGACVAGVELCMAGVWGMCTGRVLPATETCNGVDDDCDGAADDGLLAPPASRQSGVCAGSVQVCMGASGFVDPDYTMTAGYQATESGACDGVDNDCDGRTDEQHDADGDGYYAVTDPSCRDRYRTTGRWDCNDADATRQSCVVYVDRDATGANDGTSWANAYVALRDALARATAPMEVWIAEGTYYPDRGAGVARGTRTASFTPAVNVAIYGGFVGTETMRSQRQPRAHPVVLSGDLAGDDGPRFTFMMENSLRVVTGRSGVILDGVTITAGYASSGLRAGGGLGGSNVTNMLLSDVTFERNVALGNGAAMLLDQSEVTIVTSMFRGNRSVLRGAAIYMTSGGTVTVHNSVFNANNGLAPASQIALERGTIRVFGSSFAGYNVTNAIALDFGASAEVRNSVLWQSGYSGGFGTTFITPGNCDFFSSSSPSPFVDVDGPDDVRGNGDDDLRLTAASGCVDTGDSALLPPYIATDYAGLPRVFSRALDDGAHEARWMNGCEPSEGCVERCNGVDDDTDGTVDEDPSDMPACRIAGVCATAMATCSGGAWTCAYSSSYMTPRETICSDGLDNDCNAITDELFFCACTPSTDLGRACDGAADHDSCANGALMCNAMGMPACTGDSGYVVSTFVDTRSGYDFDRVANGCSGGTELHVFGTYEPYVPPPMTTGTRIEVRVERTAAPVVVALHSNDVAQFDFVVSPGATISGVLVYGNTMNTVTGLAAGVPITNRTGMMLGGYDWGTVATANYVTDAELQTGLSFTTFVGTYTSNLYTIASSP